MIKQKDQRWGIVVCARVPAGEYEALGAHATRSGLPHVSDLVKTIIHDWLAEREQQPITITEELDRR